MNEHDSGQPEEIDVPAWADESEGPLAVRSAEHVGEEENLHMIAQAPALPELPAETLPESTSEPGSGKFSEQSETLTPQLLHTLGVFSPSMVDRICAEETKTEFLVEGFLPAKSIAIVGGDSTIGKSPLICQLSLSIAAGIPFLGMKTHQGRVLYFDLENPVLDCKMMRDTLVRFLDLREPPSDFLLVTEPRDSKGLIDLVERIRPQMIVMDSLRAFAPHVTEKNTAAGEWLKEIRKLARKYSCALVIVHHLRKPSENSSPGRLDEETRVANWLLEMEGPRAFVNQTDVRVAVEEGNGNPAALKVKWSRRVRGDSPLLLLERVFEEGEAVGYRPLTGKDFLNPEQRKALDMLPDQGEWGFKEARQALGEAISVDRPALPAPPNRTGEFIQKAMHYQVVEKLAKNRYRKVQKPGVAGVKS